MKKDEVVKEEKVNQPENAPVADTNPNVAPSQDVLSHRWQANSAALDTNALTGYAAQTDSVLDKIDTPEKQKARKEAEKEDEEKLTEAEWRERTKLDVSDPRYINPSLDYHKKGK